MIAFYIGSPLTCRVLDIDQVAVNGTGVRYCAIKKTADIKIESPDISNDTNFKVNVFSPSGKSVDVKTSIMANAIGAYYTPNEIGNEIIFILLYNIIYFYNIYIFYNIKYIEYIIFRKAYDRSFHWRTASWW